MSENALLYALSTIAQCAAALAALIGFFGLWRQDRLRERMNIADRVIDGLRSDRADLVYRHFAPGSRDRRYFEQLSSLEQRLQEANKHLTAVQIEQQQLMDVLVRFLIGTLALLAVAIVLLAFADRLHTWPWLMRGGSSWWPACGLAPHQPMSCSTRPGMRERCGITGRASGTSADTSGGASVPGVARRTWATNCGASGIALDRGYGTPLSSTGASAVGRRFTGGGHKPGRGSNDCVPPTPSLHHRRTRHDSPDPPRPTTYPGELRPGRDELHHL
jgi:hypothetical protein